MLNGDFLFQIAALDNNYVDFWLGADDLNQDGVWTWIGSGEAVDYNNLNPDQSFFRGRCLQITNFFGRFDQLWWMKSLGFSTANTCFDFNNAPLCEMPATLEV